MWFKGQYILWCIKYSCFEQSDIFFHNGKSVSEFHVSLNLLYSITVYAWLGFDKHLCHNTESTYGCLKPQWNKLNVSTCNFVLDHGLNENGLWLTATSYSWATEIVQIHQGHVLWDLRQYKSHSQWPSRELRFVTILKKTNMLKQSSFALTNMGTGRWQASNL